MIPYDKCGCINVKGNICFTCFIENNSLDIYLIHMHFPCQMLIEIHSKKFGGCFETVIYNPGKLCISNMNIILSDIFSHMS